MTELAARSRLLDLLAAYATEGVEETERPEMLRLVEAHEDLSLDHFELAAAGIQLTEPGDEADMPAGLQAKVRAHAKTALAHQAVAARLTSSSLSTKSPNTKAKTDDVATPVVPAPAKGDAGLGTPSIGTGSFTVPSGRAAQTKASSTPVWYGWAAAAAILLLATFGAIPRFSLVSESDTTRQVAALADQPSSISLQFGATEDPAAQRAKGEVVWNDLQQKGYMKLRGLPINDATDYQYQLWIFDALQDERYPIDGGIFNIDATGEVFVPIDAKLLVIEPTLFAITIEKPGGVVVSSRERIVLAAAVS